MSAFTVYILYSYTHDRLYIGFSSDHIKRLKWHNELTKEGFTVSYRPWAIVHTEPFDTKPEAMKRERELKSARGRKWIREVVLNQNEK